VGRYFRLDDSDHLQTQHGNGNENNDPPSTEIVTNTIDNTFVIGNTIDDNDNDNDNDNNNVRVRESPAI
jgi:hypothetical protein